MLLILNRVNKALILLEKVSLEVTLVNAAIHVFELTRTVHLAFLPVTLISMTDCPFVLALTFNMIFFETAFIARPIRKDLETLTMLLITIPATFVLSNNAVVVSLSIENL